jgi:hypothetical protein
MIPEITWDAISIDLIERLGLTAFQVQEYLRSAKTVRVRVAEGRVVSYGSIGTRAFQINYVVRVGAAIEIEVVDAEEITPETLDAIRKEAGI